MPRAIDHEQRRAEIGAAVLRLVAREGIDAVTVRRVAAESGWSTGVLAHYFDSKDEILAVAFQASSDAYRRRFADIAADAPPRTVLRAALTGLLPLDEARRDELLVWYGFVSRVLASEMLRAFPRDAYRELRTILAEVITAGQHAGEIRADLRPGDEARALLAFCDGLALQHLFDPAELDHGELVRLLERRLAALEPAPDVRPGAPAV
ncbi:DNA-binding transcriptional regulator YbjK [Parafrankia irregularis]|uniref:DNA-binding transcriptional regulator YbjK n=1 Tax=Parafrankia irregularis TaxID=795642 RepID=A0A0S4QRR0_9ACTN|nr:MULTISPECIES: TetR/AcrR family transcriptional regulator [Parafrankia]MBE3204467.1 TetR family transcriptional regulator [Parafrankia sp. CH37]CUU57742.1 DNA-binding transcriptional regulator YbjK [Parafrankia irregularis]